MMQLKEFKGSIIDLAWEFEDYWNLKMKESPDDYPRLLSEADWYEQFIVWMNLEE